MNMWGEKSFDEITIAESDLVPRGGQALTRAGKTVYIGALSDPIEDAEFDGVVLNPYDFQRLKDATTSFQWKGQQS